MLRGKAGGLWKEYALLRDGRGCKVQERFPELNRKHSTIYQVDHCFSRSIKALFFETANSTVICSNCNMSKGFKNEPVRIAVESIVEAREGSKTFEKLKGDALHSRPFLPWKSVEWVEGKISELEQKIREIQL